MSILLLISDVLSIITISICFIQKVPQILMLIKVKNANGINLAALLLELSSYTIMFSYNYRNGYAILSYLEYPVIILQQYLLIVIVMYYKDCLNIFGALGAGVYAGVVASLFGGVVPLGFISFLVPLCTPIGASCKVVQLLEILRKRDSESVSVLTWFISSFTNLTRVFTITMDSGDLSLLLNFSINVILSSAVTTAAYWYKPQKTKAE